jgi:parvulin-like peptidyl-prolyl isomerase
MGIRISRFTKLFLPVLFSAIVLPGAVLAEVKLVAKVGSVPVTNYELARSFQRIMPLQGNFHGGVSAERKAEIRQEALDVLIERAYKVQYALSEEISVSQDVVDEKIAEFKKKFISEEVYQQAVEAEGQKEIQASLYRQLLAQKAEELRVDSKVQVTADEVKAYYEANKARFMQPRQFKASHILIRVDPASNSEERKEYLLRAEELLKRARAGEDFYNLAYYNSDDRTKYVGGDLGYFHEGQTVTAFEQALMALKPGEISELVKTRFGYHIILLVDVQEPRQLSYDDMAAKIRSQLEKERRDTIYQAWMDELKARFTTEIF